jgi:hypothetical protein
MSKPALLLGSSVGFKKETQPGTKIALAGGSFVDLMEEALNIEVIKYAAQPAMGTRQKAAAYEVFSHNDAKGSIGFRARPSYMAAVLEWIFGGVAGSVYRPILDNAELPCYTVEASKGGLNKIRMIGTKVNKAIFKSEAGQPLMINLDLVGMSGERDPGDLAAPSYAGWISQLLYMHSNMTFSSANAAWLNGIVKQIRNIELTFTNNLDESGFTNSTNREFIGEGMFDVEGTITVPYDATTKGFWAAVVALDLVTLAPVWTSGANSITGALNVRFDGELPKVEGVEPKYIDLKFHGVEDSDTTYAATMTIA